MIVAEFGTGQVFLSMLYFFLFFIWIWLVITLFADVFRSQDLTGWGKAAWSLFMIFLPFVGVFTYLIVRGRSMAERQADDVRRQEEAFRGYVRKEVAAVSTDVDQLERLASLRADGVIDEEEFQRMKAKVSA